MVSTRSGSASPAKKNAKGGNKPVKPATTTSTPMSTLRPGEPLRVLIAPRSISITARFITLPNPISQEPERYLFCPSNGVYQLTRTSGSKHAPHSILFTPENADRPEPDGEAVSNGYVNKSAELLTATPFDCCFTLLPLLTDSTRSNLFQTLDDILENENIKMYDLPYVYRMSPALVEDAMQSVCDTVEAGDEKMFRYSSSRTLELIITKAKRVCAVGLPFSLEDRFVTRMLEAPMLSVKREESTISVAIAEPQDTSAGPGTPLDTSDSQSTTASTAPSLTSSKSSTITTTSISTATVEPIPDNLPSSEIISLQRLLIAFKYITQNYLSSSLSKALLDNLQSPSSSVDFAPLAAHLSHIAKLHADAAASVDMASFSRKRGFEDDFEAEERAEKKKKLEEEEKKKKANMSRGVKALEKVDVKGMKKMSAFFTKATPKARS